MRRLNSRRLLQPGRQCKQFQGDSRPRLSLQAKGSVEQWLQKLVEGMQASVGGEC